MRRHFAVASPLSVWPITSALAPSLTFSSLHQSTSTKQNHNAAKDDEILSILDRSIPLHHHHQSSTNKNDKINTTNKKTKIDKSTLSSSSSTSPNPLVKFLDFDILKPNVAPTSFSYICPPKWTTLVAEVVQTHFGYQVQKNQSQQNISSSSSSNLARRPELFLQSFVHTSFLRDYERKKIQNDLIENRPESAKNNNKKVNDDDEDDGVASKDDVVVEEVDCSMARLAEIGGAILQYSCTVIAPLMSEETELIPHQQQQQQRNSSGLKKNMTTKKNLEEFSVFPLQPTFISSKNETENDNDLVKNSDADTNTTELSAFIRATFASPSVSMTNLQILQRSVVGQSADHNLSLICFNVWKTSDLVLTDAGIYGLRDAMRSSSKEKLKVPPLPMPAAAMNVRAMVGAVYLNFGLEEAVMFCQKHVICHAVSMMHKERQ